MATTASQLHELEPTPPEIDLHPGSEAVATHFEVDTVGRVVLLFANSDARGVVLPDFSDGYIPAPEPQRAAEPEIAEPIPLRYPDLTFAFNERHITGTGVVQPSYESRLRTLIHGMQEAWDGYSAEITTTKTRTLVAKMKNFTDFPMRAHLNGTKRHEMLPMDDAVQTVLDRLSIQNHPTYQACKQFYNRFAEKIDTRSMKDIKRDVVVAFHTYELREVYHETEKAKIKALKESAK